MAKNNGNTQNKYTSSIEDKEYRSNNTQSPTKQINIDMSNLSLEGSNVVSNVQGQLNTVNNNDDIVDTIKNIINSNSNINTRLSALDNTCGKLALALMDYETKMNSKNSHTLTQDNIGINNYNLFNRLNKVINIKDYTEFVKHFDIVNFMFNKFKDDAYSEFALNRSDLYFTGDKKQLRTFQHLITLVCILCDPLSRVENKRKISTQAVLNRDVTSFTETAVNNIKQYYDL